MDSQTSHLDDLLSEKLEHAFHKETSEVILQDVAKIALTHSPIDLAYAAFRLPPSARAILFQNLASQQAKVEFLLSTDSATRLAVLRRISEGEIRELIDAMAPDEAVRVLEVMSERKVRRTMELVQPEKRRKIQEIQKHERNTAGRLMTSEFFAFRMDVTIAEAASFIRNHPGIDLTRRVFVVDEEGILRGLVPARHLIINPPQLLLRQVMRQVMHKVTAEATREEIVDIVERYKVSDLPVVDEKDHLLGVITYEDVVEAMEDIADQTIALMAGTVEKVREHEPLLRRFFSRSPWLVVTLAAGLVNGALMSFFQGYEGGLLTFLMLFVPLITGLSGNIGIQCSTILVRSMATGLLSIGFRRQAIGKELFLGVLTGLVFAVASGFVVSFFDFMGWVSMSPMKMGLIVGIGLFGACLAGTFLGVFSPFFFVRLRVDPAIASGPIIMAFNDFLAIVIYFLIAFSINFLL